VGGGGGLKQNPLKEAQKLKQIIFDIFTKPTRLKEPWTFKGTVAPV
jgi:hypothetical protein